MPKTIFLLILLLITACRQNDSPSQLKFKAYESNPILSPGAPGSWDDLTTGVPNIIWHDSVFYLFYMGRNVPGRIAIGLATSYDGIHYQKFGGNPVLASDNNGFDAFTVGPGIVVKEDSLWAIYFNAPETAGLSPGPSMGRATAKLPAGPWTRSDTPVLTTGSKGEWDAGFVIPSSILALKEGGYIMYYSGGYDYITLKDFFIGMATSSDGINWKKYNDPITNQHPYTESDPFAMSLGAEGCVENPSVLFLDTICYMYYDYSASGKIGLATARVH